MEESIATFIRDITKLGSIPKSEARRRINEIIEKARQEERDRIIKVILSMTEIPKGARNPTRDAKVIFGEDLINLI